MKQHKIRVADCIDSTGKIHVFVQLDKNTWQETSTSIDDITHSAIHEYIQKQKSDRPEITIADRCFHIGLIQNWKDIAIVQ
jgi:23S rRNA G2445 N2-methylase RlmL